MASRSASPVDTPTKTEGKRAARKVRLARFSARLRLAVNVRQIERFGLDITGHGAADERRKLRNARKRERHAA